MMAIRTRSNLNPLLITCSACLLAACAGNPASQHTELSQVQAVHLSTEVNPDSLLNRVSWGLTPSSSAQIHSSGAEHYLDQQLHPLANPLPVAIQAQINAMTISQMPLDQLIPALEQKRIQAEQLPADQDNPRKEYQQELNRLAREAATRSVLRAVYSQNQLQEQMVWFWMNHFNIHSGKANERAMLGDFEETAIRPYALGRFHDLLRATVFHPAMMRYLDNEHNAVNRINENYARELMELHTMGVNSGYTQRDVQEMARVLTGFGINQSPNTPHLKPELQRQYFRHGLFEFNPARHDYGDKQVLGTTLHGAGVAELDQALNLLCRQPATAKFVSRKLAMYFVSDQPSDALINTMAQRFLQTDGNIAETMRTLFESREFANSLGSKFKDPVHYAISSVRLAYDGATLQNATPLLNWINSMGEQLNAHQTPDGYPLTENAWASPGQMVGRFDIAKAIANGTPALFKNELQNVQEKPVAPALASSNFVKNWAKTMSPATQQALAQAKSNQEWGAYFLASPEMMHR